MIPNDEIPCFVCNKKLPNLSYKIDKKIVEVHPMDGLHFRTYGHYGSTIFDPMDGTYIDIAICDDCVKEKIEHTRGNGEI